MSFEQYLNAGKPLEPIEVQFSALKLTSVKSEQPSNATSPIQVMELGIVIDVKPEPWNAKRSIDVTELGIIVFLQPTIRVFLDVEIIALQLSRESYVILPLSTFTSDNPEQFPNAVLSINVTEFPIVTEVNPEQPQNVW